MLRGAEEREAPRCATTVSNFELTSVDTMRLLKAALDRIGIHPIRHHYESPLVYASDLRAALSEVRDIRGLNMNESGQLALLSRLTYQDELVAIPRKKASLKTFGYDNAYFGAGDAEYFYSMIRHFKPHRILEIGSGESTLLAQLAVTANKHVDERYSCEQICVEPFAHPWLDDIGVTLLRQKIEHADPSIVDVLDHGDILFIDSSHVIRPQGDVLYEYLHLLGRLRSGVLVHVHDIFTPRDYPEQWIIHQRRLYAEQYLLEAFLCFNSAFQIIGALNWLWHSHRDLMGIACPMLRMIGGEPGSFWLVRV